MAFTASQAFDLLRTAFSRNRLPHALLIVGDEHQGASRLILQLLELINGIRADHLDSVRDEYCRLVRPKSKSRRILRDDIRAVEPFLQQRAAEGKWKIAVFMDAERMNDEAANAFLKPWRNRPASVCSFCPPPSRISFSRQLFPAACASICCNPENSGSLLFRRPCSRTGWRPAAI